MTSEESARDRSPVDRLGQLVFVLIVCTGVALALAWLGTVAWPHWWFWLIEVPGGLLWALLLAAAVTASLRRRR